MEWIQPIYDRTQSDIDNKTSKGYLNYTDMNRIENNIGYIAEQMGVSVETKTWTILTMPTSKEMDRIKDNIDLLKKRINFTTYQDCPDDPINTFTKVNTIESLIEAIEGDLILVMGNLLYAGDDSYCSDILI